MGSVPVHGHALTVATEFPISRWRDRPAATMANCARFFECEQLLGAEGLIVDLRRCLDEVLQMGAGEEVAEIDKLAVIFILN
jgi:hypothetical protein